MVLFVGVTLLALWMACYYRDPVKFKQNTKLFSAQKKDGRHDLARDLSFARSRQHALNLWITAGIFAVLSALSALRIASGNDYWNYTYMFSLIAQGRHVSSEFLFNAVVRLMQLLFGQGNYLVIFGLFSLLTVFFFLKGIRDQSDFFLGSLFLFLMNGYYFSSFNSVRYYLVLAIALYAMKYVFSGEYGKFVLWILIAAGFHKSVLLVIPVYLIAGFLAKREWKLWQIIIALALFLVLASSFVWGKELYRRLVFTFYPYYENSMFDNVDYSLTNIGKCLGTLGLCFLTWKTGLKESAKNRFYALLNLGGLLLYTVGAFIPEISRVAYYLVVPQIFLIPNLLTSMKDGVLKKIVFAVVFIAFAGYFGLFLRSAYQVDVRILPYLNWVFN